MDIRVVPLEQHFHVACWASPVLLDVHELAIGFVAFQAAMQQEYYVRVLLD